MKLVFCLIFLFSIQNCAQAEGISPLAWMARTALKENIMTLSSGNYLRAGANHFGSLWTRDFCYSAPGLIAIGRADVVRDQVTRLLDFISPEESLVPRSLDNINTVHRVILRSLHLKVAPPAEPLRPEYQGEHKTAAIDSNILLIRAAWDYVQASGDWLWWQEQLPRLQRVYNFYQDRWRDGLIEQEKFSDWQDSVKREGATFLTNFLFWQVSQRVQNSGLVTIDSMALNQLKNKLWQKFYAADKFLFRSQLQGEMISLDGNLWALLDENFWPDQQQRMNTYKALKLSPLWHYYGIPGLATFPNYPSRDISWTTKAVGLRHYHDQMLWPWLTALALEVSKQMADQHEFFRVSHRLQELFLKKGAVDEIYAFNRKGILSAWKKGFYTSEQPFSWSAAMLAWALR